jgi:hypothetical protein
LKVKKRGKVDWSPFKLAYYERESAWQTLSLLSASLEMNECRL